MATMGGVADEKQAVVAPFVEKVEVMKLLVCGGRDYKDRLRVFSVLDAIQYARGIELIIHGDARGADRLARDWAIDGGTPQLPFPADWDTFKNAAGPIRNRRMLVEGNPHAVVVFPGGSGTANMVTLAKRAGKALWRFDLDD